MPLSNGYNLGLLVDGVEGEEHYLDLMKLLRGLDGLVQPRVEDKDRTSPPVNIVDGQMYIIPAGATGAWSGRTNMLARGYSIGTGAPGWQYFLPKKGWSVLVLDEGDKDGAPLEYRYTGTAWQKPDLGPTREEVLANPMTHLGDIIYGGEGGEGVEAGNAVRLPIGQDLQILTALDGKPVWRDAPLSSGGGTPGEGDGMANPMLLKNDIIVGGDNGAPARLAKGAVGTSLQISSTGDIFWGPQASGGGFTNPMTASGDLMYGGPAGAATRLAKGDDGQVLKMVGGLPAWAEDLVGTGGGGGMVNPMTAPRDLVIGGTGGNPVRLPNGTAGQVLGSNGWMTLPDSVPTSAVGVTVASLDGSGKVPAAQLPSYVDDVLEFNTLAAFPFPGESGKIYVALNTNQQYRWPAGGTDYVQMVSSPGTTDAVTEGTVNKYWTAARTLATTLAGLVTTSSIAIQATDTIIEAFGKLQAQLAGMLSKTGGAMTGAIGLAAPVVGVVASGTLDLSAINSNTVLLGGTDAVGYLGFGRIGDRRTIISTGSPLFYNGENTILPGGADVTLNDGDSMEMICKEAGIWRCIGISRKGKVNSAVRVLTPVTNNTATLVSIPILTVPLDAASTYEFHAEISFMTAAASTGGNIGWLAPSGSDCLGRISVPITTGQATSALVKSGQVAALNVIGSGTAAGQGHVATLQGIVTTTTAGNFTIQFASSVAGSLATIQFGSILSMRKIG